MFRINPILPKRQMVDRAALTAAAQRAMRNTVVEGARFMSEYPPQRLTKTGYRRTGTLKRSWSFKVETTASAVIGTVGSNSGVAPYNRDVQGPGTEQKAMFRVRGGWQNVDDLNERLSREWDRNEKDIEDVLRR